ncbi:MAG: hypothetical protein JWN98_528 [Abditibacteriota bacterium]|nr:hypothetical protein [Abditibacteriota bacterium]
MLIFREFRGEEQMREFAPDETGARSVVIGRPRPDSVVRPDFDLTPDFTVSRPHAAIWIERAGQYWIEDLGSTHGTRVNAEEIKGLGRRRLHSGDVLQLGETTLRIDAPIEKHSDEVQIGQVVAAEVPVPALLSANLSAHGIPTGWDDSVLSRRLALVYELPLQFAAETRLSDLLQTIVHRLVEVIPDAARGALVLREKGASGRLDTNWGEVAAGQDAIAKDAQIPGAAFSGEAGVLVPQAYYPLDGPPVVSKTLARRAMAERAGFIWRRGEESDAPVSGSIIRYSIETGMYAPLLWQGRALGAVCVDNPGRNSSFTPDDLHLLLMVAQYAAMAVANQQLQEDLRAAWTGTLDALTSALASRDYDTQSHCYRTVELSVALAQAMGVPEEEIGTIARGALLHDIGKIGIADDILLKTGNLSPGEREIMKQHVRLGHEMLQQIPFFADALPIVLYHHENYDGSGYLEGLSGDAIPRGARIFHVVDLYDALTQDRPYKPAWTHEQAINELKRISGIQCDPEVVTALDNLPPEVTQRIRTLQGFSPAVRELLGRGVAHRYLW